MFYLQLVFSIYTNEMTCNNDYLKRIRYAYLIRYADGMVLGCAKYTILPKVLGHPLLMKCLTTLAISKSTNLNV